MDLLSSLPPKRIYDLAEPLDDRTPRSPTHPAFSLALIRRHGDAVRSDGSSSAYEAIHLGGHTGTHIDAFSHLSLEGQLHGGVDVHDAMQNGRFKAHGVESIEPFFGRAVLLDVPASLGVETLIAGQRVTAEDLAHTAASEGVEVRSGDAILVRTGRPLGRFADMDKADAVAAGVPGPDESAARWLQSKGVRLTGSDTIAYEWLAPGAGFSNLPAHVVLLYHAGIPIIEVLNLEEIARDCLYEFLLVVAPLRIVGGTGSPVRPLAVAG